MTHANLFFPQQYLKIAENTLTVKTQKVPGFCGKSISLACNFNVMFILHFSVTLEKQNQIITSCCKTYLPFLNHILICSMFSTTLKIEAQWTDQYTTETIHLIQSFIVTL